MTTMFYVVPCGHSLNAAVAKSESFLTARRWADREALSRHADFEVIEVRLAHRTHHFSDPQTEERKHG